MSDGIRRRVELGGTFALTSRPAAGTTVIERVHVGDRAPDDA